MKNKGKSNRRTVWWSLTSLVLLVCLIGFYLFGLRLVYRHWGYLFLKGAPTQWPAGTQEQIKERIGGLTGKVVWSSSRTGTHQLYLMSLPDLRIYQLTNHPHVNYYPRLSPEGRRVVFARSQRPWVSEREQAPWDVYVLELTGGKEQLIARNGNFPQWLPDGERILFLRKSEVVIKDLPSGREQVIFDGRKPPWAGEPSTPELSPWDPDLLTVTLRGKTEGVFIFNLIQGTHSLVSGTGCESLWRPDRPEIAWVENGGRGGTHLLASPADRLSNRVFMDLPGSFSHEYFPRFSSNGRWLVWGASAGDHEHDIADYEIFLWQVGKPWESAVRMTYNPANDRWPDIHLSR
ncbi:MAG: PD40 domain-containing protein [Deltaproteobacteria bacterium]|nr:PD40 domain-containing protein [Deltaproteobacteria bacterium]